MRVAEASSIEFYRVLNQNRTEDLAELKQFERREDITNYEPVLREILSLFGQAIKTSLERTMGKYLKKYGRDLSQRVAGGMGGRQSLSVTFPQQRRGATLWNCQGLS